jgi:hypothetical protein
MVVMKLFSMKGKLVLICTALLLLSTCQPSTGLNIISPGNTVFLGEEGIDISSTDVYDGSRIGWWAPGSSRSNEPTEIITISSPSSFYVSPSVFSGKEGPWYSWPDGNLVFRVKKPQVSLRVHDETADFDATGKWVPRGDVVSFKISSNIYEANSRGGSAGQADIVLTSPRGAKFSSVTGPSGSFSLSGVPLTSSLTSTGPVWGTIDATAGSWSIQAELSMNRIKDNLPETGAGISAPVEIIIQNVNPLIKSPVSVEIETPAKKDTPHPPKTEIITPTPTVTKNLTATPVQIKTIQTTEPVLTEIPSPVYTAPATTKPTPEETPASTSPPTSATTPAPEGTRSPMGIITVTGALLVLLILRREDGK